MSLSSEYNRKRRERRIAGEIMHREFIETQCFPSCLNCDCWRAKEEKCQVFAVRPPAEVIVFSCGENWVGLIPF